MLRGLLGLPIDPDAVKAELSTIVGEEVSILETVVEADAVRAVPGLRVESS